MAEQRDKFEEWREAARRKAREFDEKLNIKELRERVGTGARAAQETFKQGASRVMSEAERARLEAERIADDMGVGEHVRRATDNASKVAQDATRFAKDAAKDASKTAHDVAGQAGRYANETFGEAFNEARGYYERAAEFYEHSARLSRLTSAATVGAFKVYDWARKNPRRAITVSLSVAAGVRIGAAFPSIDGVLLGSHPHWFTHSALPVWALRKAGEKFDSYLRERETLVANGELSDAEQKRVKFERDIVRYVGAPLLGAFSFAAGGMMIAQIFQTGAITGAPVSWLLGGNPLLDGIWLFANGVVCFHQGYKFFMIALGDQHEAQRIVSEIKGLLPA